MAISTISQAGLNAPITLTSPVIAGTPTGVGVLTSGTAVASTSGTSIDFTSIPSWVKRITVMFNGVSTNGTSAVIVQLGTSGSPTTSGYTGVTIRNGASANVISLLSSGFNIENDYTSASAVRTGNLYITLLSSSTNNWTGTAFIANTTVTQTSGCAGTVSLSGVLNLVRITTVGGTDTFDAGSVNILYE